MDPATAPVGQRTAVHDPATSPPRCTSDRATAVVAELTAEASVHAARLAELRRRELNRRTARYGLD